MVRTIPGSQNTPPTTPYPPTTYCVITRRAWDGRLRTRFLISLRLRCLTGVRIELHTSQDGQLCALGGPSWVPCYALAPALAPL